jgi:hypothetical protein
VVVEQLLGKQKGEGSRIENLRLGKKEENDLKEVFFYIQSKVMKKWQIIFDIC